MPNVNTSAIRAELTKVRAATDDLREMQSISAPNLRMSTNIDTIDNAIQEMDSLLDGVHTPIVTQQQPEVAATAGEEEPLGQ